MRCCDYTSGMLREPITVERQQTTDIGGGATEISWLTRVSTRAHVKQLSGNERLYAQRLDATTRNRIVIRYNANIVESDRVVMRNRNYNIKFINNIEFRDKWLEIDLDGGQAT